MRSIVFLIGVVAIAVTGRGLHAESPSEIYQRLVIPLIQSSTSSSCSECHLQGVNLNDFLTADPKASFASLRARGWIDTRQPANSKLLQFVAKKPEHSTALMDRVRQMELEGISRWIDASVNDPETLDAPLPELDDLKLDDQLMRHVRNDQIVSRFVDIVWSQFERCANCHSPDRNAKQIQKHGEQMSWIVPNSPVETLRLLEQRNLIDVESPLSSLLKTKALGDDDHGGGVKFARDGHTDRQWGMFLSDYASIRRASYSHSSDIPKFDPIRTWRTGLHLRVSELSKLPAGKLAVVLMHPITDSGVVDQEPTAMGEGRISADGKSWAATMMLIEPVHTRGTQKPVDWTGMLPESRYQLRLMVVEDANQTLQDILKLPAAWKTEVKSLWPTGHRDAKTIALGEFTPVADNE